jgi:hypothetical protein
MRFVLCICASLSLLLAGCGDDATQPIESPESAFDRQVRENCEAVYEAVLAHYDAHGRYAWDDDALVPFLPDGLRLVNPATGETTEPIGEWGRGMIRFPEPPGATGYRVIYGVTADGDTYEAGFIVVGRGNHCDIMLTNLDSIDTYLALEEAVIENCKIVAAAAEAFAFDNNGVYATDSRTTNNAGLSIQDYFPNQRPLMNPYSGLRTVPYWGAAAALAGSTGYVAIDPNGDGITNGYNVDGVGGYAGTRIYVLSNPPWTPGPWTYSQWDWTPFFCK